MGEDPLEVLPDWEDNQYLLQNKTKILDQFNLRYECRQIGQAIPGEFYRYLRLRFLEVDQKYNILLQAYEQYSDKLLQVGSKIERDYQENRTSSMDASSQDDTNGSNIYFDSPQTADLQTTNPSNANQTENTATNKSTSNGTVKAGITEVITEIDSNYLDKVNDLGDKYKHIVEDFVLEFEDVFLSYVSVI